MDVDETLAHYLMLFRRPGWREYTWARVKELARDNPLYRDLPEQLRAELEKEKDHG